MARDIEVKTRLSSEEYLALNVIAEEEGMSHSGLLRQLLKARIRLHVHDSILADGMENGRPQPAQKRAYVGTVNPAAGFDDEVKQ